MRPDGSASSTLTRTNHITTFDFLPSGQIVFAQLDFADRYRVFSDLYIVTPGGSVRRVTEEARLTAPSVGPDEAWAVAVVEGDGTNGLVRVDLRGGSIEELVPPEADTHWAYPAVSPDGRWIAATRWTEGLHDVVILDAHGRLVHEVTQDRALDLAPTWSASGRHLVWSSDRTGILNILASEVDLQNGTTSPPIMLTNMRTGATFPSVDPAGDWIYFSGYHVDGWEVERVPFEPGSAPLAPDPAARFDTVPAVDDMTAGTADAAAEALTSDLNGTVRGYTPLPTLRPTYWLPSLREPTATGPTTAGDVRGSTHRVARLRGRRPNVGVRPRRTARLRGWLADLHIGRQGRGRHVVRVSRARKPDCRSDGVPDVGPRWCSGAAPAGGGGGLARDLLCSRAGTASGGIDEPASSQNAHASRVHRLRRLGAERPGNSWTTFCSRPTATSLRVRAAP